MKCFFKSILLLIFTITPILDIHAKAMTFHYPELMVVPKASKRIELEAKSEQKNQYLQHIPIQTSAALNFLGGILQFSNVDKSKDDPRDSAKLGVFIGGGWLLTTFLLSKYYNPYRKAHKALSRIPAKTQKEKLARERLAEEHLKSAAKLGTRLKYLAFLTNLPTAVYMLANTEKETISVPINAAAVLASFAPLVFTYSWNQIYREQMKYKKKIYAPLIASTFFYSKPQKKYIPGVSLSWSF